jgi:hypothetical protein
LPEALQAKTNHTVFREGTTDVDFDVVPPDDLWIEVEFELEADPAYPCKHDPDCPGPPPRITANLYSCDGRLLQSQTTTTPSLSGCDPEYRTVEFLFDYCENGEKAPSQVEIIMEGTYLDPPSCTPIYDLEFGEHYRSVVVHDIDWANILNSEIPEDKLHNCLACPIAEQPSRGRVVLYKTNRTLYTLRKDAGAEAVYGETVNGRFTPPRPGLLHVQAEFSDGLSNVVDVKGSESANDPGWQIQPTAGSDGRQGVLITSSERHRVSWDETTFAVPDPHFAFNIRTYRGTEPKLELLFHFYTWDSTACCVQHEVEKLPIQVKPLPCHFVVKDPVTPEARLWPDATNLEVRLPCCADCKEGSSACGESNLTDWFVTWPAAGDKVIRHGHAKGWRVESTNLISPGTDRVIYEFEEEPLP